MSSVSRFSSEDVRQSSNIKSSVQRNLKLKFAEQYPLISTGDAATSILDEAIPKKLQMVQHKCEERISLYSIDGNVVFFQKMDDELYPFLKFVHKYPSVFPSVQVDRGAIKFVLSGANIMCPGLTSKGAKLPEKSLNKGDIVAVYAEGKENALAVGKLVMSTDDIKSLNKGIGIELVHYLGDGLWNLQL